MTTPRQRAMAKSNGVHALQAELAVARQDAAHYAEKYHGIRLELEPLRDEIARLRDQVKQYERANDLLDLILLLRDKA